MAGRITFMGAGSTVFAKNVLGDCMCSDALKDWEMCLYDIDGERLNESRMMLEAINHTINGSKAAIHTFLGVDKRKDALKGADFVVNAIQVGGYEPCTVTDFEIPQKYGLRQTIADTTGIGGIMRALRTIPVVEQFARDMEDVCPDAYLINYTNPMSMLTGYIQRYTSIKTVGICHSVQVCAETLLRELGMEDQLPGCRDVIAGINHMAWLLSIHNRNGEDLYPEIRRRAVEKNKQPHNDMVRMEYIKRLGYYCTESSEHNAEYNPFFIKSRYPQLIERYQIPLDEYPRRCINQIRDWKQRKEALLSDAQLGHVRTSEYASYIMEAIADNRTIKIGGNVLNTGGLIENLPNDACVEVPCLVDGTGITPCRIGRIPVQLAAMNMSNINVHQLTIEAAYTRKREHIYHAAMLDPHTAAELSIDDIVAMVDECIEAHGNWLPEFQ